ncbi:tetratricopeptide repeat protein [bacterium]|nr:tetratricopeptide repeat protein [bacterium]
MLKFRRIKVITKEHKIMLPDKEWLYIRKRAKEFEGHFKHEKAEEFYRQALIIARKNKNFDSIFTSLKELAVFLHIAGNPESEKLYTESLKILEQCHKIRPSEKGTINKFLGDIYFSKRNWEKAEAFYRISLKLFMKTIPIKKILPIKVFSMISCCCRNQGKYDEAIIISTLELDSYISEYPEANSEEKWSDVLNDLAIIHRKLGNQELSHEFKERYRSSEK